MILSLKRAVPLLFPFNAFFYFILRLILRQIGGFVNEESASLQESIGFVFQGNIYKYGILRMQIPYP